MAETEFDGASEQVESHDTADATDTPDGTAVGTGDSQGPVAGPEIDAVAPEAADTGAERAGAAEIEDADDDREAKLPDIPTRPCR